MSNGGPLAKYKLVFLGDQSVGKTSIITRFMVSFENERWIRRTLYNPIDIYRLYSLVIVIDIPIIYPDKHPYKLQIYTTLNIISPPIPAPSLNGNPLFIVHCLLLPSFNHHLS